MQYCCLYHNFGSIAKVKKVFSSKRICSIVQTNQTVLMTEKYYNYV